MAASPSYLLFFLTIIIASSAFSCLSADSVLTLAPGSSSSQFSTQNNESFWRTADFTLGFKRLADANQYLLCIWRTADLNQTALWWPLATDFNRTALLLSQGNDNSIGAALIESPAVANGTVFRFTSDGSLQLSFEGGTGQTNRLVLWSVRKNASLAELQNTGNLVLRDENNMTVWQSFGDRRDTMILPAVPGSSADVNLVASNSRLLQSRSSSNQSSASYAPGRFHVETDGYQNLYLHAVEEYYGVDFIYSYGAINVSGYFTISTGGHGYNSNASMGMSLVKLDPDSNVRVYVWSETVKGWNETWELLQRRCFLANACGPFGICTENSDGTSVNCSCTPGYSFLDPLDASKGCRSTDNLNFTTICREASNSNTTYAAAAYAMVEIVNSDYDYGDIGSPHSVSGVTECGQLCLQLCECAAASFVVSGSCYLKGNNSGGILMNGYTTDSNTLLMKLLQNTAESSSGQGINRAAIFGGVAGGVVILLGVATAVLCAVSRRKRGGGRWRFGPPRALLLDMEGSGETGPAIRFTRQQLVKATDNFRYLLGEGGFGKVYKGWVKQKEGKPISGKKGRLVRVKSPAKTTTTTEKIVAVKVLKRPLAGGEFEGAAVLEDDAQMVVDVAAEAEAAVVRRGARATRQFRAEVNTLGKIHHVNLVNLIGYCDGDVDDAVDGRQMRALVFEFMERGSLERYLSGKKPKNKKKNGEAEAEELSWERRYSIALGMARGIAYLHHECSPPILHSDIKPQNVLLDADFTAKIADFGFARRFQDTKSHLTMSVMQGTRGYMAPEWLRTDEINSKVDVYSFGVVLLELVRGLCESYRQLRVDNNEDSDLEADLPLVDWAFRYLERFSPASATTERVSDHHPDTSTTERNDDASANDDADGDNGVDGSEAMKKEEEEEIEGCEGDRQPLVVEAANAGGEGRSSALSEDGAAQKQLQQQRTDDMGKGSETERVQKMRLLKVGLWCVQYAPQMRPSMQQVLRWMEGSGELETPPYPGPKLAAMAAPFPEESSSSWRDDSDSFMSSSDPPSHFVEAYSALSAR